MQRQKILTWVLVVMLSIPNYLHAQGWTGTFSRKATETTLSRTMPARVVLMQRRIRVEAQVANASVVPAELAGILKTQFTTEIQRTPGFIVDETNPQTKLEFTITNFSMENRNLPPRTINGQSQSVTESLGDLRVSYRALDEETGVALDAANLTASFAQQFCSSGSCTESITPSAGKGTPRFPRLPIPDILNSVVSPASPSEHLSAPPTRNQLFIKLVDDITRQMASRAAPTEETITVPLPRGVFEEASQYAVRGDWGSVLEIASKMPALEKPSDDAFRFYMIGLAKEARGYAATDTNSVFNLLLDARNAYREARARRPKDDQLIEAENRIRLAVQYYEEVKSNEDAYKTVTTGNGSGDGDPNDPLETEKRRNREVQEGTNEWLIFLSRNGFSEDFILSAMQELKQPRFDASPTGLVALKRAQLPETVIAKAIELMRRAASSGNATPTATAKPRQSTAPTAAKKPPKS